MIHQTQIVYDTGVIHGRFQVLHNDHLKYLMDGKRLCRHMVVGITNPDPFQTRTEAVDPDRSSRVSNPLTYYERYFMIRSVLQEAGVGLEEFSIVPFPVNFPERYQYYVPLDAVFFLSIYDEWGRKKQAYFQSQGLKVHVLREVAPERKGCSAKDVRALMAAGKPWEHLTPQPVADLMKKWAIPGRLQNACRQVADR